MVYRVLLRHAPYYRHADIIVNRHGDSLLGDAIGMPVSPLGKRIFDLRKDKGLTQGQLAELAGVRQSSISDLETGETAEISGGTLVGLANVFGVRSKWLYSGRGPKELDGHDLTQDEIEMLEKYRRASPRWRLSLRLLADVSDEEQNNISEAVNALLMASISAAQQIKNERSQQFSVNEAPPRIEKSAYSSRTYVKRKK
jgi:transcriptional regulator with XRE-family HTH domain